MADYQDFIDTWRDEGLCYKCKEHRPIEEGNKNFCGPCREQHNNRQMSNEKRNPEWYLWSKAKKRAKSQGLPFTIKPKDISIPDVCPVLNIPLQAADNYPTDASPSLDKIVPHLGYVPGNIAVISRRANMLKNNATLEELKALVLYVEEHLHNLV